MQKYCSLVSSILIMLCLGGVYAWSVYVPALKAGYGLTTAQTQWIFGVTIAVFTIVMFWAGRFEQRYGPKMANVLGTILFTAGYGLAAWSRGQFLLLLAGIGILSGAGIGVAYLAALSTPVKWFPRQRGLITGLSVAGFGGGAIVCSMLVEFFLVRGLDVLTIFWRIGSSYGLVILLSAFGLAVPANWKIQQHQTENALPVHQLVCDRRLWALFAGMFAGTFAGLLVVGNLKPIGLAAGISEVSATLAISLLAIGNALGRVLWGRLADRWGGRRTITLALFMLAFTVLLLLPGARYDVGFCLVALLIGVNFGANFVLFAAEALNLYGVQQFGRVYPLVFLAYGVAGILGPPTGGGLFDLIQTYSLAILLAAILCIGGAALVYTTLRENR